MSEWKPISRPQDDGHTYVAVIDDPSTKEGYRYYTDADTGAVVEFDAAQAALLKRGVHPDDIIRAPEPEPAIVLDRPASAHSVAPHTRRGRKPKAG